MHDYKYSHMGICIAKILITIDINNINSKYHLPVIASPVIEQFRIILDVLTSDNTKL